MNYYKQGDAANASQIKAAFKKLGIDALDFGFADKTVVYCSIGGCVQPLPYSINLMHILYSHPDYKELELPVEPKFKVGDWIVRGEGFVYEPSLITEIRDYYVCELLNGERVTYTLNDVHKNFHLWTIADAKDGDVLVYQGEIFLFNLVDNNSVLYRCCFDGELVVHSFYAFSNEDLLHVHPATKEQRDLLFAKMKEAGYEWDADKKELRKIKSHYDISNFHAGMPVLVRDENDKKWCYLLYSHYDSTCVSRFRFNAGSVHWHQCIPFNDDTKHLLGTTDMPSKEYINW